MKKFFSVVLLSFIIFSLYVIPVSAYSFATNEVSYTNFATISMVEGSSIPTGYSDILSESQADFIDRQGNLRVYTDGISKFIRSKYDIRGYLYTLAYLARYSTLSNDDKEEIIDFINYLADCGGLGEGGICYAWGNTAANTQIAIDAQYYYQNPSTISFFTVLPYSISSSSVKYRILATLDLGSDRVDFHLANHMTTPSVWVSSQLKTYRFFINPVNWAYSYDVTDVSISNYNLAVNPTADMLDVFDGWTVYGKSLSAAAVRMLTGDPSTSHEPVFQMDRNYITIQQIGNTRFDLSGFFDNIPATHNNDNLSLSVASAPGFYSVSNVSSNIFISGFRAPNYTTAYGQWRASFDTSMNIPTKVVFTLTDINNNTYSVDVMCVAYSQMLDTDSDGLDDRTGQTSQEVTDGTSVVEYTDDEGQQVTEIVTSITPPPGGGSLDDYDFGGGLAGISQLPALLSTIGDSVKSFFMLVTQIFSFLPAEIWILIALGITIVVTLRILGR